jgi:hypothetical protein
VWRDPRPLLAQRSVSWAWVKAVWRAFGGGSGFAHVIWFYELESHRLQGETEAEDDVVRVGDPDGAVGLEDAARLLQPPDVELVILSEPHRANRVTTSNLALPAIGGE